MGACVVQMRTDTAVAQVVQTQTAHCMGGCMGKKINWSGGIIVIITGLYDAYAGSLQPSSAFFSFRH